MIEHIFRLLVLLAVMAASPAYAAAYHDEDIEEILAASDAPAGVVIETTAWGDQAWAWAAPVIADIRKRLRARFPDIDVVVVSHGGDQFQLTREREKEQPEAIAQLASLSEEGVSIHVCGVHSQWNDVPEDAYLDFVDVSASGPAQIRDYVNLGYRRIELEEPE